MPEAQTRTTTIVDEEYDSTPYAPTGAERSEGAPVKPSMYFENEAQQRSALPSRSLQMVDEDNLPVSDLVAMAHTRAELANITAVTIPLEVPHTQQALDYHEGKKGHEIESETAEKSKIFKNADLTVGANVQKVQAYAEASGMQEYMRGKSQRSVKDIPLTDEQVRERDAEILKKAQVEKGSNNLVRDAVSLGVVMSADVKPSDSDEVAVMKIMKKMNKYADNPVRLLGELQSGHIPESGMRLAAGILPASAVSGLVRQTEHMLHTAKPIVAADIHEEIVDKLSKESRDGNYSNRNGLALLSRDEIAAGTSALLHTLGDTEWNNMTTVGKDVRILPTNIPYYGEWQQNEAMQKLYGRSKFDRTKGMFPAQWRAFVSANTIRTAVAQKLMEEAWNTGDNEGLKQAIAGAKLIGDFYTQQPVPRIFQTRGTPYFPTSIPNRNTKPLDEQVSRTEMFHAAVYLGTAGDPEVYGLNAQDPNYPGTESPYGRVLRSATQNYGSHMTGGYEQMVTGASGISDIIPTHVRQHVNNHVINSTDPERTSAHSVLRYTPWRRVSDRILQKARKGPEGGPQQLRSLNAVQIGMELQNQAIAGTTDHETVETIVNDAVTEAREVTNWQKEPEYQQKRNFRPVRQASVVYMQSQSPDPTVASAIVENLLAPIHDEVAATEPGVQAVNTPVLAGALKNSILTAQAGTAEQYENAHSQVTHAVNVLAEQVRAGFTLSADGGGIKQGAAAAKTVETIIKAIPEGRPQPKVTLTFDVSTSADGSISINPVDPTAEELKSNPRLKTTQEKVDGILKQNTGLERRPIALRYALAMIDHGREQLKAGLTAHAMSPTMAESIQRLFVASAAYTGQTNPQAEAQLVAQMEQELSRAGVAANAIVTAAKEVAHALAVIRAAGGTVEGVNALVDISIPKHSVFKITI